MTLRPKSLVAFYFAGLLVVLAVLVAHARADCGVLYRQQVQQVYYAPYVQAYAQPVYYGVGESIRLDAIAEKIAQRVEQRLGQRLAQAQQVSAPVNLAVFQKCAKCHGTPEKTGMALDGRPVDVWSYVRWERMALDGQDVPPEMQPVLQSLSREEKVAIHTAMRQLVTSRQAAPPPDTYPVPPPDQDGGLR